MNGGIGTLNARLTQSVGDAWSATAFDSTDVQHYARGLMQSETRRGLIVLCLLSLIMNVGALLYVLTAGREQPFLSAYLATHGLLAALSVHIAVSARWIGEIRPLNLMGMALLVVTGAALMLLAHRVGSLNAALMAGVALLFMAMPIMPWGLKESLAVTTLVYLLLSASATSVAGRFDQATLWTLQFLVIASAVTAMILITRNVCLRKHDVRARFDLEKAREEMERLSNIDPLTGAWNRRFLKTRFAKIAEVCQQEGRMLEVALLDIDQFKQHNDTFGHHIGDQILCTLSDVMLRFLPGDAYVIRLGGDEFAVLHDGGNLPRMVSMCLEHLKTDPKLIDALGGEPVGVSAGFARWQGDEPPNMEALYQDADQRLYEAKERSRGKAATGDALAQASS